MDFLLGAEDDEAPSRRRAPGSRTQQRRSRRRRKRQRRKGYVATLFALVIIVGVLGGAGYYGFNWVGDVMIPKDYTGEGTGEVVVEINEGATASDIAQMLEDAGVVASARAFVNAVGAAGKSSSLQPGQYAMRKGMSAAAALTLLDPKNRVLNRLTIREGLRLSKIYTELSTATGRPVSEFRKAAKEDLGLPSYAKGRLEGYAFPATYEISPKQTPKQTLAKMVERFTQTAERLDLDVRAKQLGFTPRQIMIIASIVQAESGSTQDMPKVARVIYNRLGHNPQMTLSMDSTVMYGLGKYGIAATHADLKSTSRYNTYKYLGLPPGPISNPGEHAIEAALKPADGNWLFFVTVDPKRGITKFTDSDTEHQRFVEELNRNTR
ncbi:endolytic transglycosylase MltG [Sphaerimonospora thailandensis]|uniref:Endolytic murein transglycosylase n=1 Tax=Sphaerimonospora thailandensis TaxID=795644 RepID=A0A8J3R9H9_9ACTN|nr:endolytic transglycosylase MltG [Sphaerimonospora thailandensis]GIH70780.1 ABC transporter substrate-binding protein [Sphaerimonospora thailandensis]